MSQFRLEVHILLKYLQPRTGHGMTFHMHLKLLTIDLEPKQNDYMKHVSHKTNTLYSFVS